MAGVTRSKRIFNRMRDLGIIDLLRSGKEYVKLEVDGFMPLSFDRIWNTAYSPPTPPPWRDPDEEADYAMFYLGHTFTQNGDLMDDPLMIFRVDMEQEQAEAISFEMTMPFVQTVPYRDHLYPARTKKYRDINGFAEQWMKNLIEQGFSFKAASEATDEQEVSRQSPEPSADTPSVEEPQEEAAAATEPEIGDPQPVEQNAGLVFDDLEISF